MLQSCALSDGWGDAFVWIPEALKTRTFPGGVLRH